MQARKMNQDEIVLRHLQEVGSITPVEASTVYKIRSLTSVIARLRKQNWVIKPEWSKDLTGQRYVRYRYPKGAQTNAT